MAERRMFAKSIIDSDAFLDMPATARLLYYDLAMRADDDGFVNSPKKIMRIVGASMDDLNVLAMKKFILPFDNGVVVIKHWRIHNYIRKDTYNGTHYIEEMALLEYDENKAYRFKNDVRQRAVDEPSTQVRLGKESLGKDSIDKNIGQQSTVYFPDDELLEEAFKEFREMRKKIKKPMTDGAIKRMIAKLTKLEPDEAVRQLNRSVDHNWQDIYPEEEKKKEKSLWDEWKDL